MLDEVNHFSMVALGSKIQELSAFIKRAMQYIDSQNDCLEIGHGTRFMNYDITFGSLT